MRGRPTRVLVVDDNEDDIEILRIAFARSGPGCTIVGSASTTQAQGLLQAPGGRPDLLLLDWKMPGMNAEDFIRSVRTDPRTVGLPVLVFSSSDDPADVRAAYAAGATAYMAKPLGLAEYEALARDVQAFWCRPVLYPVP